MSAGHGGRKENPMTTNVEIVTKLYRLTSVIDDWPHRGKRYNNVTLVWFVDKRDYDPGYDYPTLLGRPTAPDDHSYEKDYVDELFTRDEADQLAQYLQEAHDTDVTITEVSTPVPDNIIGVGAIAVGGDCDFYMLSEHDDYTLPFKAWGYYRVDDDSLLFESLEDLLGRDPWGSNQ
jgi:hypothetical protein